MQLERNYPSKFDSDESLDPELTTEGLVAGCGLLVLKSIKRERHQYSTFDVGSSMFDVQSFHCPGQAGFHTSPAAGLKTAR